MAPLEIAIPRITRAPVPKRIQVSGSGVAVVSVMNSCAPTPEIRPAARASVTIDQREIPDNQVVKVPEQGQLTFQPGKDKALEYFPAGQNCVIFTYWQVATGPESSFTKNWCFTAF